MITFEEMKKKAAAYCGLYDDAPEMVKIADDINIGVKMFNNAARRYYTKKAGTISIKSGQDVIALPNYVLRLSELLPGDNSSLMTPVVSDSEWAMLTTHKFSSNKPTHYFVLNGTQLMIYPTPIKDITLKMYYEPKMVDMSLDDICIEAEVTNGSDTVVCLFADDFEPSIKNNCYLTVDNGIDGYWYRIVSIDTSNRKNNIILESPYQGATSDTAHIRIGQCPSFPEEYHLAPVHYAAQQFFLLRKDLESAGMYGQLFDKAFAEYRRVYGKKTSSGVINGKGTRMNGDSRVFPGILRG